MYAIRVAKSTCKVDGEPGMSTDGLRGETDIRAVTMKVTEEPGTGCSTGTIESPSGGDEGKREGTLRRDGS